MITTNEQFDAKNAELAKQPIYVLTIGGEAINGSEIVYSTLDLVSLGVINPPAYRPWLKTPQGSTQSIDILNGTTTVGQLECEIVDQANTFLALAGTVTLEGRSAVLSVGYPGMDYANFVALHTYQIFKVLPAKDYTAWRIFARDRGMTAKKTVWVHPENGNTITESNPWILFGTPAEITQAVYLFGLGRPETDLDRAALAELDAASEGLYKTVRPFQFSLTKPFEAKQFLEQEIYKVAGLYPVINNLGQLSLRAFRPRAAGPSGVFSFDDNNCIVLPEVDRQPIINEWIFKFDEDADGGGHQTELIFINATSVDTYGRAGQHVIESSGLRSHWGAWWFCQEVAAREGKRFSGVPTALRGGAPLVRLESFLLTLPVWAGDFVYLSHPLMPDILTGVRGVTNRLFEVIDREPDFARGRMRYRLLDTGLTGLEGARKFASSDRDFIVGVSALY